MRQVKHSVRALLFVVGLIAWLTVPLNAASAASAYDSVINSVDSVHLSRDGVTQSSPACASLDITSSWANILIDSSSWTSRTQIIGGADQNATLADWATARMNGAGWAVVQQHNHNASTPNDGSPLGDAVYVVFTPSALAQINFSSDTIYYGAQKQAYLTNTDGGYVYSVRIQFDDLGAPGGDDQCTPVISMALRDSINNPWFKELLSVGATSTEGTGGYSLRPLFVNAPFNYPLGYEGELAPTEPPAAKDVAMGDSFSSGEGNPPFEAGTDISSNSCHRSPHAYPRLLQSELGLGSMAFVACSGATTNDILGIPEDDDPKGKWTEPAQIDALSEDTETVTITIGGNDVGFRDFAVACTVGSCDFATTAYSDIHGKIANDLPGALANVYEAINNATSSTADIYVIGYPQIAPAEMPTGPNSACWPLNGGTDNPDPELNDGATAHAVVSELNSVIRDAVADMDSAKFHFVDPNLSGSPFIGHDWCQQDRYFDMVTVNNIDYSFHPNRGGHGAYKTVVGSMIS
jgi:hypothetical protein